MRPEKKIQRRRAAIAAELGIELPEYVGEDIPGDLEAEAVLAFVNQRRFEVLITGTITLNNDTAKLDKKNNQVYFERYKVVLDSQNMFSLKACENCGQEFSVATFATSVNGPYAPVAYCSTDCRIQALRMVGIKWDPHKSPEQRWGRIPKVISPAALHVVGDIAADTDELPSA